MSVIEEAVRLLRASPEGERMAELVIEALAPDPEKDRAYDEFVNRELAKAEEDIAAGRVRPIEDVFRRLQEEMKSRFGVV